MTTSQLDEITIVQRSLEKLEAREPLQTVVTTLNLIIPPLEKLGIADKIKAFKDDFIPEPSSRKPKKSRA
jgi:hypothetical protein